MRTFRHYKNYGSGARLIAWTIDLTFGSLYRVGAALGRATGRVFRPAAAAAPAGPRKFLLIRLDHIGDLLMTTPAIRALKRRFPASSLSLLASPSSLPVVAANPDIDRMFAFRVPWYDGGRAQGFSLAGYFRLLKELRRERFDVAVDFRGDIRVLWLFSFWSRAKLRVGFSGLGGEFLLHRSRPYDQAGHFVDLNLSLAGCIDGLPEPTDERCVMPVAAGDAAHADRFLAGLGLSAGGILVAIQPTTIGHWRLKRWPPERFAALADALAAQAGATIVLTGAPDDLPELERIAAMMTQPALIAAGQTSLPQLAGLLERCRLFVANDTGPMHVAAAVGTPLVAVFGPTAPGRSGPRGNPAAIRVVSRAVPCRRPCFVSDCPIGHECMQGIDVAAVLQACLELLGPDRTAAESRP